MESKCRVLDTILHIISMIHSPFYPSVLLASLYILSFGCVSGLYDPFFFDFHFHMQ